MQIGLNAALPFISLPFRAECLPLLAMWSVCTVLLAVALQGLTTRVANYQKLK